MKKSFLLTLGLSIGAIMLAATSSYGAALASDNASDVAYDGPVGTAWATGDNGGSGFGAWTLTATGASGFFTGDSALNAGGTSGNINTNPNNRSWGEFANTGGVASAVRTFTVGGPNSLASLAVGQQFSIRMDNGFINTGGTVGFGLQDSAGVNRFELFFAAGATSYTVSDSAPQSTTHGFTGDGLTALFTLTGVNTYALSLTYNTGVPVTEPFTGTLKGTAGNGIDRFRLFNANAGTTGNNDAFFNSAQVIPEPSTFALSLLGSIGMVALRRRRK